MFYENILSILDKNKFIRFEEIINYKGVFEEFPLLLRYEQVNKLDMNVKDINVTLFNLAFFHLKNIKVIAKNKLKKEDFDSFFICLTITDEISDDYFIVPNFYVSDKKNMFFLKQLEKCENHMINDIFTDLDMLESLSILQSSWFDKSCNCKLTRYYIVSKEVMHKLKVLDNIKV